jgi:hypothetical protein
MSERSPYDGKPYYCADCGLGLREFYACEWPTCKLESEEIAAARAWERAAVEQKVTRMKGKKE